MDRCTQLVLHPLRNVQPVQLVVQEMAESAVVLPRVADDASDSIQYSLELVCGGLGENGEKYAFSSTDWFKCWKDDSKTFQIKAYWLILIQFLN